MQMALKTLWELSIIKKRRHFGAIHLIRVKNATHARKAAALCSKVGCLCVIYGTVLGLYLKQFQSDK